MVVFYRCINNNELLIVVFVLLIFIFFLELWEYFVKVLLKFMILNFIKKLEIFEFLKIINGKLDRKKLEKDEFIYE